MTPSPNQLIKGVRDLLRTSIGPELQSEQARFHLRKVMAVLRGTDWDEAAFALAREVAALQGVIAEASAWVAAHPQYGLSAPDAALPGDAHLQGFALVQANHAACRRALAGFIERCAGGMQHDGDRAALRTQLAQALARIDLASDSQA